MKFKVGDKFLCYDCHFVHHILTINKHNFVIEGYCNYYKIANKLHILFYS